MLDSILTWNKRELLNPGGTKTLILPKPRFYFTRISGPWDPSVVPSCLSGSWIDSDYNGCVWEADGYDLTTAFATWGTQVGTFSLRAIDNANTITCIDGLFNHCDWLCDFQVHEYWAELVSAREAFANCSNLNTIVFKFEGFPVLDDVTRMFYGSSSITDWQIYETYTYLNGYGQHQYAPPFPSQHADWCTGAVTDTYVLSQIPASWGGTGAG